MLARVASHCAALTLALFTCTAPLLAADTEHPSAKFSVSEATAIPGRTLSPGSYSVRVVDHLSDRYIMRVDGPSGHTLFIGVPSKDFPADSKGEITWSAPANGATYIRGWNFASLPAPLEFAYPKNDAVAIAKANNAHVTAIDPESEGILSKTELSKDEMHIITLWLLSPTQVGPDAPAGIQAARLQQVASLHKPVVARLPHTASAMPWVWLLGIFSLFGALSLRTARFVASR